MKKLGVLLAVALVLGIVCWLEPSGTIRGRLKGEPFFQERAAESWRRTLSGEDPAAKEADLKALAGGGEATLPLLRHLLRDSDATPEVRWTAAELLGKLGSAARPATADLIKSLDDSDSHVRTVVATTLSQIEAPASEVVGPLTKSLDREATVPALRALSVFGADAAPALPKLVAILNDKSLEPELRWNAARTIGKMHAAGASAIPDLVSHLEDPADRLREHAAEALGDIGPDAASAVEPLVKTLGDSYFKARRDAVRSLGQIGPAAASAVPAIEKLLEDPEQIVRDAAKTALERIRADGAKKEEGEKKE